MSDIEFIDPKPPDRPGEQAGHPDLAPYDPDRTRFVAAGVLALGAAILGVVAAYQKVYAVGFGSGGSRFRYTLNAWGAYGGAGAVEAHRHGPAYARVLIITSIVFAVLGVSALGRAFGLRAKRFDTLATAVTVGATGVLLGLLSALYLEVTSVLDGIRASLQADVSSGDPVRGDIRTTVGHCAYFALGALACGVLSIAASVSWRRPEA